MWWIEVTKCLNYCFTKPCLWVWLVQFGETHSLNNYCQETHPAVQCAAVMTHCSLIRVPPHHGDTFLPASGLREVRPTCHPSVLTTAFSPPTIRWMKSSIASRLATSNLFWPQTAMTAEVFSSWSHQRQIQMILYLLHWEFPPCNRARSKKAFRTNMLVCQSMLWFELNGAN